ncbi:MAG: metal-dependent transcriptional regulator [Acidobacteria bacterium]|nr:metal-dependent transcriptional regulator [Acidobacteriota bacterium]
MRKSAVTSTAEDYLKAVLRLEDMKEKASTSNVARRLDVSDGTVTDMLRKLQSAGLLEYTPYYGAALTPRGRAIALKILRRHRLIELFLHRIMGYGWEQVHDEAERLEHAVSDFFVERIDALMNHPSKDPHGEVIPDARGFRESENDISLAEAGAGSFTIRKVINADPELLTYLNKESLVPAQSLTLLEKVPFQGPLKLRLRGSSTPTYVAFEVAQCIFVCPAEDGRTRGISSRAARKATLAVPGKRPAQPRSSRRKES